MLASGPTPFQCEACGFKKRTATAERKELLSHVLEIFPDRKVAQYEITDVLGLGGQGVALELERNGRQYVGKVIDHRLALAPYARKGKGAVRGSEVLKHLDHPGIPKPVEELDVPERRCSVFIREKAHGRSLREIIDEGTLNEERTMLVMRGVLDILAYTHDAGQHPKVGQVIHRDIKPGNIILGADRVSLIDFDTSKFGSRPTTMTSVGTFDYQPLEQVLGTATPASDVYSLGVTCIEALLGDVPDTLKQSRMPGSKPYQLPTHVSSELRKILEKMVWLDASERYQRPEDILRELDHVIITSLVPGMGRMDVPQGRAAGAASEFPVEDVARLKFIRDRVQLFHDDIKNAYSEKMVFGVMAGLGGFAQLIGLVYPLDLAFYMGAFASVGGAARCLGAHLKERDTKRELEDHKLELAWREEPDPEIRALRKQIYDAHQHRSWLRRLSFHDLWGEGRPIEAKINELEAKIHELQPCGEMRKHDSQSELLFFYESTDMYEKDLHRVARMHPEGNDIHMFLDYRGPFGAEIVIKTSVSTDAGHSAVEFRRSPFEKGSVPYLPLSTRAVMCVTAHSQSGMLEYDMQANGFTVMKDNGYEGDIPQHEARAAYTAFHEKIEKKAPDVSRIMYAQISDNKTFAMGSSFAGPATGAGI